MTRTNSQWMWMLLLIITLAATSEISIAEESKPAVGIVIMTTGKATADDGRGARILQRRSEIHNRDVITTEKASRLQIRFTDGSLLSLQEDSSFKIKDYRYKSEAGNGDNAAYSLLKGSMRTISGAIGKVNKSDYKVETPLATIGIRGTDYELVLHNNSKTGGLELYGYINDGVINVANKGGSEDFGFNQFFKVSGDDQSPQQLLNPPDFMFEGYVPPQPEDRTAYENPIFLGGTTGLYSVMTDTANTLPDIINPGLTPFSTISNLTGTYDYVFDTRLSGGPLPTVQNGPSAVDVYSSLRVDFTAQTITSGSVNVTLSDNSTIYGSILQSYKLSDVVVNNQSLVLSGAHNLAVASIPALATLNFQFAGGQAQGGLGTYSLTEIGVKLPLSVTGNAIYQQQLPLN